MKQKVTLSMIWKKPKYRELVSSGEDVSLVMWKKNIYENMPSAAYQLTDACNSLYTQFVTDVKNMVESIHKLEDTISIQDYLLENDYIQKENGEFFVAPKGIAVGMVNALNLFKVSNDQKALEAEIKNEKFLYKEREKILSDYSFIDFSKSKLAITNDKKALIGEANGKNITVLNEILESLPADGIGICIANHLVDYRHEPLMIIKSKILNDTAKKLEEIRNSVIADEEGRYPLRCKRVDIETIDIKANRHLSVRQMFSQGSIPFTDLGFEDDFIVNENSIEEAKEYCRIYNALHDLAKAINISNSSVSLHGLLDYSEFIGHQPLYERVGEKWIMEVIEKADFPIEELSEKIEDISLFVSDSELLDHTYRRFDDDNEFLSQESMVRRAFSIYLKDKCDGYGIKNPYLFGCRGGYVLPKNHETEKPENREYAMASNRVVTRRRIVNICSNFINEMKMNGELEERNIEKPVQAIDEPKIKIPATLLDRNEMIQKISSEMNSEETFEHEQEL